LEINAENLPCLSAVEKKCLIRPLFIAWNHLKPFEQFAVCTESVFWTLNHLVPTEARYMEKNAGMFSSKTLISFLTEERKTWTSWMTWS